MIDPAIRAESSAVHRALHKVDAMAFLKAALSTFLESVFARPP